MSINHVLYQDTDNSKWQGDPDFAVTGTGFSVPGGLESVFSYNGLIMNDLTVYDKYRVMNIDGLSDPAIRDNREDKPGDDGEDTYNSYYSGRTIVLGVRVEAYSLDKLRDMEEALRTAFVNMVEAPLYFLSGTTEKDHYINCKKSAELTKTEDVTSLDYKHFREWQITLRASDPRFYRAKKKFVNTLVDVDQAELNDDISFEASAIGDLNYQLVAPGGSVASAISTDWAATGTKSLKIESSYTLADKVSVQKTFGDIMSGFSYSYSADMNFEVNDTVGSDPATVSAELKFLDASDALLGTFVADTRDIGFDSVAEIWSFTTNFVPPPGCEKIMLDISVEYFDANTGWTLYVDNLSLRHTNIFLTTGHINVENSGNYNTSPVIQLTGEINDLELINESAPSPDNNIKFKTGVTIAEGSVYIIDVYNKTIVDQTGANKISELDMTSGWLKLYPGFNNITVGDSTTFGVNKTAQMIFHWRDSWV